MKKIHVAILCFFLSIVFFIAGILFSNFLAEETKSREETRVDFLIKESKNIEEARIDTDLTEANNIAKQVLKNVYIHRIGELRQFMIEIARHAFRSEEQWSNDKYLRIMHCLNEEYSKGSIDWRWLIDFVGVEGQEAILYIFNRYQDWYSIFVEE